MRILLIVMIFVLVGHGIDAQTPWEQVSAGGFGDSGNTLPWSMAVFDDHLYVGCFNWTTGAQIWRSSDGTSFTRVDDSAIGKPANTGVSSMVVVDDTLYIATANNAGAEIYLTADGTTWTASANAGFGDSGNTSVSLAVCGSNRNPLLAGTRNDLGGELWLDDSGWGKEGIDGFGSAANIGIRSGFEWSPYMLFATNNPSTGTEVWRAEPGYYYGDWVQTNSDGFGDTNNTVTWAGVAFSGRLYFATENAVTGGQLWSSTNAESWLESGPPLTADNTRVASLAAFDGGLFAGTQNTSGGAEVWLSHDGERWLRTNTGGFGNPMNSIVSSMVVFEGALYAAVANFATGVELWRFNDIGTPCVNTHSILDTPGFGSDVAIDGNRLVVADGSGGGLRVYDITTPDSPALLGVNTVDATSPYSVEATNGYAYVLDAGMFDVYDIDPPSSPTLVGSLPLPSSSDYCSRILKRIALDGTRAYVAGREACGIVVENGERYSWDNGVLEVISIATTTPSLLGSEIIDLGYGGYYDVAVSGATAFVAGDSLGGNSTVTAYDVANPASIMTLDTFTAPGVGRAVELVGSRLYVAAFESGVRVLDVANPSAMTEIAFLETPVSAEDLVVDQNLVLLVDTSSYNTGLRGIRAVDVHDPAAPVEVGSWLETDAAPQRIVARDGVAYVTQGAAGIAIVGVGGCSPRFIWGGFEDGTMDEWTSAVP